MVGWVWGGKIWGFGIGPKLEKGLVVLSRGSVHFGEARG